jgi:glycosyltransferase involved in cell wall biosynthesis
MVERSHYDVAVAEFTVMGQYLYRNPFLPAVRRVISCHSCLTTSTAKAAQLAPRRWGSLRKRLLLPRLRRYEFALYRSADLVLTLTAEEKLDLLRYEPDLRIGVVPYGVDVDHFRPKRGTGEGPSLVFTGYYRQEDNRDAVGWFARSVWPVLRDRWPALTWYVVGSGPTREIAELGRRDPRIVVTGEVEDVAPYLARARVYVCPMRLGTGFRGKILQAMAAGVPVVATTLAAEGIPAQTGESMLLADTAHTQIEAINLLLGEPSLRRRIASKARELAVSRFAWSRCVDLLEQELHQVVG